MEGQARGRAKAGAPGTGEAGSATEEVLSRVDQGERDGRTWVSVSARTSQTVALAHLGVRTHLARHSSQVDEAAGHQVNAVAHPGKLAGPLVGTNTTSCSVPCACRPCRPEPAPHPVKNFAPPLARRSASRRPLLICCCADGGRDGPGRGQVRGGRSGADGCLTKPVTNTRHAGPWGPLATRVTSTGSRRAAGRGPRRLRTVSPRRRRGVVVATGAPPAGVLVRELG